MDLKVRGSTCNTYSRFFTLASLNSPSYLSKVMGIKYSGPASSKSTTPPETPAFPQFSSTYNDCMLCTCTYVHPHSRGKKGVKRGFNYFIPPKRYFCKQNLFPLRYLLGSKQATQVKRFKFGSHLEFELLTSSTHEMLKMLKEGTKSLVRI